MKRAFLFMLITFTFIAVRGQLPKLEELSTVPREKNEYLWMLEPNDANGFVSISLDNSAERHYKNKNGTDGWLREYDFEMKLIHEKVLNGIVSPNCIGVYLGEADEAYLFAEYQIADANPGLISCIRLNKTGEVSRINIASHTASDFSNLYISGLFGVDGIYLLSPVAGISEDGGKIAVAYKVDGKELRCVVLSSKLDILYDQKLKVECDHKGQNLRLRDLTVSNRGEVFVSLVGVDLKERKEAIVRFSNVHEPRQVMFDAGENRISNAVFSQKGKIYALTLKHSGNTRGLFELREHTDGNWELKDSKEMELQEDFTEDDISIFPGRLGNQSDSEIIGFFATRAWPNPTMHFGFMICEIENGRIKTVTPKSRRMPGTTDVVVSMVSSPSLLYVLPLINKGQLAVVFGSREKRTGPAGSRNLHLYLEGLGDNQAISLSDHDDHLYALEANAKASEGYIICEYKKDSFVFHLLKVAAK